MRRPSFTACLVSLLTLALPGCAGSPDPPVCTGAGRCSVGHCLVGRCRPTTTPLAPLDAQRVVLQPADIAVLSARTIPRGPGRSEAAAAPPLAAPASSSETSASASGASTSGAAAPSSGASTSASGTSASSSASASPEASASSSGASASSAKTSTSPSGTSTASSTASAKTKASSSATSTSATSAPTPTASPLAAPADLEPDAAASLAAARAHLPEAIALGAQSAGTTVVLFRFTPTWSDDADIASAFLILDPVAGAPPAAADVPLEVARILDPWTSDTATWGRKPRHTLPELAAIARRRPLTPVRIDVTRLVRAWSERAHDDHGIALLASGDDPVGLACSMGITDGLGPRLEVYLR